MHLFDLPRELRDNIYSFMLSAHTTNTQPSITKVCRQLRRETLQLFYSSHVFHFDFYDWPWDCKEPPGRELSMRWAQSIGEANAQNVRTISLRSQLSLAFYEPGLGAMPPDFGDVTMRFTVLSTTFKRSHAATAGGIAGIHRAITLFAPRPNGREESKVKQTVEGYMLRINRKLQVASNATQLLLAFFGMFPDEIDAHSRR